MCIVRADTLFQRIAFVFPGQGSQYVGMGRSIYERSPAARAVFERADAALGFPLSRLCFEGPAEELEDTINAQPAILTVSIACLEALREKWRALGQIVRPLFVAGHSLGEYSALVAADALDFAEAVRLVRERGRLMKETSLERPGGMAAIIGLDDATLEEVCCEAASTGVVVVSNANSPDQRVLSGEVQALLRAMELARQRGARRVARLGVSIASHSPLMQRAAQQFSEVLAGIRLREPSVPLVANITGQVLTSAEDIRRELAEQLCRPVQWTHCVTEMLNRGVSSFAEIGPGHVLSGLIRRISQDVQIITLNDQAIAALDAS
jgi:[acyl-carrier-protein] S-malonyltransferase